MHRMHRSIRHEVTVHLPGQRHITACFWLAEPGVPKRSRQFPVK